MPAAPSRFGWATLVFLAGCQVLKLYPPRTINRSCAIVFGLSPVLSYLIRRVVIQLPKHAQGKQRTDDKACEETKDQIVLLTSLVDVPAEVLGAVYRLRWSIETFFRFLKHVLGLKRLFSSKSQGVQIQVAVSIIAALLLALACGRSVGRAGMFAIEMYLSGMADEDEVWALLKREAAERNNAEQARKNRA